ncbi:MAG: cytidine deaminase [Arenimonas sp.]
MSINLKPDAIKAAQNAYSPYSHLKVGAALLSNNGNIYLGCNVENASFPIGNCAERAALAAAVLAEGKDFELKAIAVVAFTENGVALPITPCGACRQALIEFGKDAEVGFLNSDNEWMTVVAKDLLPHRFEFPALD